MGSFDTPLYTNGTLEYLADKDKERNRHIEAMTKIARDAEIAALRAELERLQAKQPPTAPAERTAPTGEGSNNGS